MVQAAQRPRITNNWHTNYEQRVTEPFARCCTHEIAFGPQSGTPLVDECRGNNANPDEHREVNPLAISDSRRTVYRYESDDDESGCNLGLCADQAR